MSQQTLIEPRREIINLGKHVLHAPSVATGIHLKDERVQRATESLGKSIASLKPELAKAMREIDRDIAPRDAALANLARELTEAFEAERPAFDQKKAALEQELKGLRELRTAQAHSIIGKFKQASILVTERFQLEKAYLECVLAEFPQAQHIDLSCLSLFRNKNGLPALALFSPHTVCTTIRIYRQAPGEFYDGAEFSCKRIDLSDWIGEKQRFDFLFQICGATGVIPYRSDNRKESMDRERQMLGAIKFADGRKKGIYASEVKLQANFADGGRTIPAPARAEIRRAEASKLFDRVLLLAEVPRWEVEYTNLQEGKQKPIIAGKIVKLKPPDPDPLIVGLKVLKDGRRYPLVIGKFDTTPIEELIHAEFCANP